MLTRAGRGVRGASADAYWRREFGMRRQRDKPKRGVKAIGRVHRWRASSNILEGSVDVVGSNAAIRQPKNTKRWRKRK